MCNVFFSIFVRVTTDMPILFGLAGERVANTPWSWSSRNGLTIKEQSSFIK